MVGSRCWMGGKWAGPVDEWQNDVATDVCHSFTTQSPVQSHMGRLYRYVQLTGTHVPGAINRAVLKTLVRTTLILKRHRRTSLIPLLIHKRHSCILEQ